MPAIDYAASAELYAVQGPGRKKTLFYRRFDTAAEALQFAIEGMPEGSNPTLETGDERLDRKSMLESYADAAYPLERHAAYSPKPA